MYKIKLSAKKRDHKTIKLYKLEECIFETSGDFEIISEIEKVLSQNNLKIENLAEVLVDEDLESFTGTRINTTIANLLNWALKKISVKEQKVINYLNEPNIHKKV